MSFRSLFAIACGAAALLTAVPVAAQDYNPPSTPDLNSRPEVEDRLSGREQQGRIPRSQRNRAPAAPTPAENLAAAQALITTAGVPCQATEAHRLGVTSDEAQAVTYEVLCGSAPGYFIVATNPPTTYNCLELASQAMTSRERDPAADVGQQCTLPANQNPTPFVAAYATEAGITCTVDQGAAIGKNPANQAMIYEVGCADADGFRIEKEAAGWKIQPCYDVTLQTNGRCRFTTADETRLGWKTVLEGSTAAACDVQQARRIGHDAQGLHVYEIKCGSGEGYFARVDEATRRAQRAQTCAESTNVAGGCTLTQVAAPAAPAPAPTTQQQ